MSETVKKILPRYRALSLLKAKGEATPDEIRTASGCMGKGGSQTASWQVGQLKREGHKIEAKREGRKIVSYRLVAVAEIVDQVVDTKVVIVKPVKATHTTSVTDLTKKAAAASVLAPVVSTMPGEITTGVDADFDGDMPELPTFLVRE